MLDDCECEITGAVGSIAATKTSVNSALLAGRRLQTQAAFDKPPESKGEVQPVVNIGKLKSKKPEGASEASKKRREE
jgi:hypothetical protein